MCSKEVMIQGTKILLLFAVSCTLAPMNTLATGCPHVTIVPRTQWGARRPSRVIENFYQPVGKVFVHHTDGNGCNSLNMCSQEMRNMQDFHIRSKNCGDITYNFVVCGDGKVYEGRGWKKIGAHTADYNTESIGIAFMGNFRKNCPNTYMMNAFKNLMDCGVQRNYLTINYKIYTHKEAYRSPSCTECPGQALYNKIKTFKGFQGGPLKRAQSC